MLMIRSAPHHQIYGKRVWRNLPPMKRTQVVEVIDFFEGRSHGVTKLMTPLPDDCKSAAAVLNRDFSTMRLEQALGRARSTRHAETRPHLFGSVVFVGRRHLARWPNWSARRCRCASGMAGRVLDFGHRRRHVARLVPAAFSWATTYMSAGG